MRPVLSDKLIAQLSDEKRKIIYDKLHDASILLNSVFCQLIDTPLDGCALLPNQDCTTLWSHLYDLGKQFNPATK